jgi:hypothetical protein
MGDSDDESEMIRKPDDDKFNGMASGVGGFDGETEPKGSIYTKGGF